MARISSATTSAISVWGIAVCIAMSFSMSPSTFTLPVRNASIAF